MGKKRPEHPRQPLENVDGVVRFRGNAIVQRLHREHKINLNEIACWDLPNEDAEQFWQLLGYSASGYGDLSFIRPELVASVDAEAEALVRGDAAAPSALETARAALAPFAAYAESLPEVVAGADRVTDSGPAMSASVGRRDYVITFAHLRAALRVMKGK